MAEPLVLPQFCAALRQHVADLGPATYYRYCRGNIPAALRFVALRPDLASALADDARTLASFGHLSESPADVRPPSIQRSREDERA
jgi:hypothetical protein